ncbi:MAG: endonuclease/exonuclease/phosphatase family protein [Opitutales bacterium]
MWFRIVCLFWVAFLPLPAVTVATYNVENYTLADRMADGVHRPAYPKPESERIALRRVIGGLDADILALQEMGPKPFLDELQRDLRHEGHDYPYAVLLESADPDRHVAVLSRLPLRGIRLHAGVPVTLFGRPDRVKRGVLEVTVADGSGEVTLFIIHLKSRRTERSDDPEGSVQRLREARAVRDLVLTRFPEPGRARFIICGDWNDTRDSRAVKALTRRGQTELGEILRAVDSHGDSWTHFYHREDSYSRIDYILVSPALRPFVEGDSAQVYDGPGTRHASDHRPVMVKLTTGSPG